MFSFLLVCYSTVMAIHFALSYHIISCRTARSLHTRYRWLVDKLQNCKK